MNIKNISLTVRVNYLTVKDNVFIIDCTVMTCGEYPSNILIKQGEKNTQE